MFYLRQLQTRDVNKRAVCLISNVEIDVFHSDFLALYLEFVH